MPTPILIHDTLSRQEREFAPVHPGEVRLYVCGMTVQDKPHIGHFLPFLTADVVRRFLEHEGYRVIHVQNFTDVDDKIIDRARQEGVAPEVVAERNIAAFHAAARTMNLLPATHLPRATEHIPEIVALIERLVADGYAYAAGGDVYFRVRRFPGYGTLSGRNVDDLMSGARIEVGEEKEDPLDFALWKGAKRGEPQWPSPWGPGRPGWHIECSAMSMKYLGPTLDMHGGGRDLIFPHHENERAQSEAATGQPFVRFWMHNGLLYTGGEKMSKSLGNFFLIEDILKRFDADEVRFFLLSTHFRSQAEFSEKRLEEARAGFERLRDCIRRLQEACTAALAASAALVSEAGLAQREAVARARTAFFAAMRHDFNSAAALGHLFELVRETNRFLDRAPAGADRAEPGETLEALASALRLLGFFPGGLPIPAAEADAPAEIQQLVAERGRARQAGDWGRADELRREIHRLGYVVEDRPGGGRLKPSQG